MSFMWLYSQGVHQSFQGHIRGSLGMFSKELAMRSVYTIQRFDRVVCGFIRMFGEVAVVLWGLSNYKKGKRL